MTGSKKAKALTPEETKNMTPAELAEHGITVAEAVGTADNGGRALSIRIEVAMHAAAQQVRDMGIADDTPAARISEILGIEVPEDKCGADFIREAKLEARARTKAAWNKEQEETRQAIEAKLRQEGQEA